MRYGAVIYALFTLAMAATLTALLTTIAGMQYANGNEGITSPTPLPANLYKAIVTVILFIGFIMLVVGLAIYVSRRV